jgi:hypothetical protein
MMCQEDLIAANDEQDVVDFLIAAHGVCKDEVTRRYIELALVHEGRKISSNLRRGATPSRIA